ncbi:hypothetical protein [Actinoplanes sp. NPDC049118]|uniref:hypothetical protein n=1 Tax=Actinoplanes sp. NPDC049118 TaxID=3155769 RepID=UPI0033E4C2B9
MAVPSGWAEGRDARGTRSLTAPGGRASLRISRWKPGAADLVAALIDEERQVTLPAYRRVRIEALPRTPGAVWEYTFRDRASVPARAMAQFVVVDGYTYRIEWRTTRAAWAANLQKLTAVLESFRPLRGA